MLKEHIRVFRGGWDGVWKEEIMGMSQLKVHCTYKVWIGNDNVNSEREWG